MWKLRYGSEIICSKVAKPEWKGRSSSFGGMLSLPHAEIFDMECWVGKNKVIDLVILSLPCILTSPGSNKSDHQKEPRLPHDPNKDMFEITILTCTLLTRPLTQYFLGSFLKNCLHWFTNWLLVTKYKKGSRWCPHSSQEVCNALVQSSGGASPPFTSASQTFLSHIKAPKIPSHTNEQQGSKRKIKSGWVRCRVRLGQLHGCGTRVVTQSPARRTAHTWFNVLSWNS